MIRLNKNDWRNFMKKLLIVVDYQKDFVNGSLGFKEAEDLDEYLASLIDQYHQNKDIAVTVHISVIFSNCSLPRIQSGLHRTVTFFL